MYGTGDRDLPTPKHLTKPATDASALQKVLAFVKASGVTGWKGFTADGTITFTGDPASYTAHVAALGSDRYRLDVEKPDGKESTIFNGGAGLFISAKGALSSISSDLAALGLFALPRLLSADYPRA